MVAGRPHGAERRRRRARRAGRRPPSARRRRPARRRWPSGCSTGCRRRSSRRPPRTSRRAGRGTTSGGPAPARPGVGGHRLELHERVRDTPVDGRRRCTASKRAGRSGWPGPVRCSRYAAWVTNSTGMLGEPMPLVTHGAGRQGPSRAKHYRCWAVKVDASTGLGPRVRARPWAFDDRRGAPHARRPDHRAATRRGRPVGRRPRRRQPRRAAPCAPARCSPTPRPASPTPASTSSTRWRCCASTSSGRASRLAPPPGTARLAVRRHREASVLDRAAFGDPWGNDAGDLNEIRRATPTHHAAARYVGPATSPPARRLRHHRRRRRPGLPAAPRRRPAAPATPGTAGPWSSTRWPGCAADASSTASSTRPCPTSRRCASTNRSASAACPSSSSSCSSTSLPTDDAAAPRRRRRRRSAGADLGAGRSRGAGRWPTTR